MQVQTQPQQQPQGQVMQQGQVVQQGQPVQQGQTQIIYQTAAQQVGLGLVTCYCLIFFIPQEFSPSQFIIASSLDWLGERGRVGGGAGFGDNLEGSPWIPLGSTDWWLFVTKYVTCNIFS